MDGSAAQNWIPPVDFSFKVDFQNQNGVRFESSFSEVNGIGWNLIVTEKKGNENDKQNLPEGLSYGNITLKRPVSSLSDDFAKWVNNCLTIMLLPGNSGWMKKKACDVIVKLLDAEGQPQAGWACYHAYPVKYSISALDAGKSDIVMETVELTYNRLERVK